MKTTTTEKAKARHWFVSRYQNFILSDGMKIADCEVSAAMSKAEMQANTVLIVKAVNEHELLKAVAEEAEKHLRSELSKRPGVPISLMELQNAIIGLNNFRAEGEK